MFPALLQISVLLSATDIMALSCTKKGRNFRDGRRPKADKGVFEGAEPLQSMLKTGVHQKRTQFLASFFGALLGTRTLDPLIKSQLLYQLS